MLSNRGARGRRRFRPASRGRAGPRWAQPGPGARAPEHLARLQGVAPGLQWASRSTAGLRSSVCDLEAQAKIRGDEEGTRGGLCSTLPWTLVFNFSAKTRRHFPSGLADSFEDLPSRGDGRGFLSLQLSRRDAVLGWGARLTPPQWQQPMEPTGPHWACAQRTRQRPQRPPWAWSLGTQPVSRVREVGPDVVTSVLNPKQTSSAGLNKEICRNAEPGPQEEIGCSSLRNSRISLSSLKENGERGRESMIVCRDECLEPRCPGTGF